MDEVGNALRQPSRSGPWSVGRTSLQLCGPDPSSLPCSFHTPFVPLIRKTLFLSTSTQTIWVQLLIINNTRQGWLPEDQLVRPFPLPTRNLPSGGERLAEAISGISGSAEIDLMINRAAFFQVTLKNTVLSVTYKECKLKEKVITQSLR